MDNSAYAKFIKSIAATKPFSKQEEKTYFSIYATTTDKNMKKLVRDKIVASNMRFVLDNALQYKTANVDLCDIISAGAAGLIKAVENFDVTRGLRFITYALYWVKSYINYAIDQHKNLIAIPWNRSNAIKASKKKNRGNLEFNSELDKIDAINRSYVAFDNPIGDDFRNTYADVIADKNTNVTVQTDTDQLIAALTSCLPESEKRVLCETYGINSDKPHSLREIGTSMGCSHSRIKQLRDQAMRRIKKYTSKEMLQICREQVAEMQ